MKLPAFKVVLAPYHALPRGYGVGWLDVWTGDLVCFPMPFHWFAGAWYWLGWKLYRIIRVSPGSAIRVDVEREKKEAYEQGYQRGLFDGTVGL